MLVLSRKKNEVITLGPVGQPFARITLLEIRGDKVRIGIDAEREIEIHRAEVASAIAQHRTDQREGQPAASIPA